MLVLLKEGVCFLSEKMQIKRFESDPMVGLTLFIQQYVISGNDARGAAVALSEAACGEGGTAVP